MKTIGLPEIGKKTLEVYFDVKITEKEFKEFKKHIESSDYIYDKIIDIMVDEWEDWCLNENGERKDI